MAEAMAVSQPRQTWRGTFRLAVVAAALLISGCQTMIPKGKPPPTDQPPPVERPDEPGDITTGLPQDKARHRVALLVPMTGANAGVGQSIANAANLAVLDTGGNAIRITTYDTATGAAAAAQKALAEGNTLILGPLLSEDVRAVAPVARARGVPLISFSNDSSVAGNGTYLLGFSPAQSIRRVVEFARSKGMTRFAGLVPNGVYGQRSSNALLRAVEASGGQVVSMQNFDRSKTSITAAITRMSKDSAYQAVLIADNGSFAAQAVPLIRRSGGSGGATAKILGTELWNTESGLVASVPMRGAWFASVPDNLYTQLVAKYRARYGRAPYRLASMGYDSVLLVTRISRDWKVGQPFPVKAMNDAGGFSGIDGPFRFGRDGIADRMLEVQQIDATGFTTVSSAPKQFQE